MDDLRCLRPTPQLARDSLAARFRLRSSRPERFGRSPSLLDLGPQTAAGSTGFARRRSHSASSTAVDAGGARHQPEPATTIRAEGTLLRNVFGREVYRFDTVAENASIIDAALMAAPKPSPIAPAASAAEVPLHLDAAARCRDHVRARCAGHDARPFTGRRDTIDRPTGADRTRITETIERGLATRAELLAAVERSNLTRDQRAWFLDTDEALRDCVVSH